MPDKVTVASFRDVLSRYLRIADHDYKGHVHDNVLNIFNDLDEEDRKLFLRGVVHIHSVVIGHIDTLPKRDHKPPMVESARDLRGDDDKDPEEDEVVEYINKRQRYAMQMWMLRAGASLVALFLFTVFVFSTVGGSSVKLPFIGDMAGIAQVLGKVLGTGG